MKIVEEKITSNDDKTMIHRSHINKPHFVFVHFSCRPAAYNE